MTGEQLRNELDALIENTDLWHVLAIAHEQLTLALGAAERGDAYEAKLLVWGAKKALARVRCPRRRPKTTNPARKGVEKVQ